MLKENLKKIDLQQWSAPELRDDMPHGDMPGDKIAIGEGHIAKAKLIFPKLIEELKLLDSEKAVISVFGGSGVGKSETASLLAYYLSEAGVASYVMSGDNYPYRIPLYNDAERASIFRSEGLKALVKEGLYDKDVQKTLDTLWKDETDPDPKKAEEYPWLKAYQEGGRKALKAYLGTEKEQDYEQVNDIIAKFKEGKKEVLFKRMGRSEEVRYYDAIDVKDIDVLVIEWTHGGNGALKGIDIPILLNSTPEETREHRRLRARDGKTDSAFTTMVLEIEQEELFDRAKYAKIIVSKSGEFMDRSDFEVK
ncbi:MAG: ATP-binding protein [Erysipelotrichaceae bacterium]|nr:ATP-binding protein [Erysipelotrichaceae bacterium]